MARPGCFAWLRWRRSWGRAAWRRKLGNWRPRVSEGRFYVACIGQFKRGKSTLINALDRRACPAGGFYSRHRGAHRDPLRRAAASTDSGPRCLVAGNRHRGAGRVCNRRAQPREFQGSGGRGSVCAQPPARLRHVPGGYARAGIGIYGKQRGHRGFHTSRRCRAGGDWRGPALGRRGVGPGRNGGAARTGFDPGDQQGGPDDGRRKSGGGGVHAPVAGKAAAAARRTYL